MRSKDADRWISATEKLEPTDEPALGQRSAMSGRIWLEPTASEGHLAPHADPPSDDMASPTRMPPTSSSSSSSSSPSPPERGRSPGIRRGGRSRSTSDPVMMDEGSIPSPSLSPVTTSGTTGYDVEQARRLFDGDETFIRVQSAAAWLGEPGPHRAQVRGAYIGFFDWNNRTILAAVRELCGRLILKAETQQVDRILEAVSTRWCECNPNHGFKASGEKSPALPFSCLHLSSFSPPRGIVADGLGGKG